MEHEMKLKVQKSKLKVAIRETGLQGGFMGITSANNT